MSSVMVKTNWQIFERVEVENLRNAGRSMADRVFSDARMRAPKLTGALRSDGRVEESADRTEFVVKFGDSRVPYARKRHYENRSHPDTKYYLQDAGKNVAKMGLKEFL